MSLVQLLLPVLAAASSPCPSQSPAAIALPARAVHHVFQNGAEFPLTLSWIDAGGKATMLATIPAGAFRSIQTHVGHRFVLTDPRGDCRRAVMIDGTFGGTFVGTSRYRPVSARPGWHVMLDRALDPAAAPARTALAIVTRMLAGVEAALPPAARAIVRRTPIFVHEHAGERMAFHQDPGWLVPHGRTVELVNAIEIPDAGVFVEESRVQPGSLLHELAHAYHAQLVPADRVAIETAYARAMATPGYRGIKRHEGSIVDAYARTNAAEYFAELAEAYFSRNDFFPFTRPELAAYDPEGAAMVARLWGVAGPPVQRPLAASRGSD